jgi:CubicO group peptidase (beta-lactamase class C family)
MTICTTPIRRVFLIAATVALAAPTVVLNGARPQAARTTAPAATQTAAAPAERQFRAWLTAFNAGNRAQYDAFLREHFPSRAPRIEGDLVFRMATGGFDLLQVETTSPTSVTCLIRERAWDSYVRATAEVDGAAPYRLTRLAIDRVPPPASSPIVPLTDRDLPSAVRAKLEAETARDAFAGAALVARHGRVLYSGAFGMANRTSLAPNTLATRFRMGSMNKMFTATAVLQLVQAGRVKLDAPLGAYLTDYPNKAIATKVTVHHLLTHTGGTGNIFGPEFTARRLELRELEDYVALYGARDATFEPASKWEYSNYGFLLLGVIVQRVSGQSYYDYVRDHIFVPSGMTATGSDPEDRLVPDRVTGYTRRNGAWADAADTLPYRGTSAGGGYTTVEDLLRFATALTGHRLLDATHTTLLTSGKVDDGRGGQYAYGFVVDGAGPTLSFGHSGGAPGMNGDLRIFPASGFVVAALTNTDVGASQAVSWIGERLPR